MVRTFRVLAALLSYPTAEMQAAAPELAAVLDAEGLLARRARRQLGRLIDEIAEGDLFDLQERYVLLFDRTRALSLHLFEHVHGESRDRGQAMVDLMALYERHGYGIAARELPDYLPMFLEFLSLLPANEAVALLGEPLHVIEVLRRRLAKRGSLYAAAFAALEAVARHTPDAATVESLMQAEDDDPEDLEALDRVWQEEAVTFGPAGESGSGSDGCAVAADLVRRFAPESGDKSMRPGPAGRAS